MIKRKSQKHHISDEGEERMKQCYTGTKKCGCLVAIVCRDICREDLDEILKEYKELGYVIEEMNLEEAKKKLKICSCNSKSQMHQSVLGEKK